MNLGKDVFHALALIVWADGVVHEAEATALLGAAEACGLDTRSMDELRRVLMHPQAIEDVTTLDLGAEERSFVYGIATWLTRVDGFVSIEEVTALARLGDLLCLSPEERRRAETASFAIASYDAGSGAVHDIQRLAREIRNSASAA